MADPTGFKFQLVNYDGTVSLSNQFLANTVPSSNGVGALWAWGYNTYGQLGNGNTINYSSPVIIGYLTNWKEISCGYEATAAIKTDGTLWFWGNLPEGGPIYSSPIQIGALTTWTKVFAGYTHRMVIKTDGTLWGWGTGNNGELGNGTTINYSSPIQIGALTNWSQVSCSLADTFAIKTDGTLWAWGLNQYGQLGNGTTIKYSSPIQIGSLTTWSKVSSGYMNTAAIKTDGTLWAWGYNSSGQLGNGTTVNYSSPIQIGALTNWSQVSAGFFERDTTSHVAAIKTDGTLWAWGRNSVGQLGIDNVVAYYSSPVQVGSLTNWKQVTCNQRLTVAIKTDGTLWTWGSNGFGQLGKGNTIGYSSPVQVGSLTNWSSISSGSSSNTVLAISNYYYTELSPTNIDLADVMVPIDQFKTRTLFGCGYNDYGQLGNGDANIGSHYSSPIQIGSLTNWSQIETSKDHSAALGQDGSLWTWGRNLYGQLGQGDTTQRASPSQVGTANGWKLLSCGYRFTMAIKTNGTLWAWGSNGGIGVLGNGTTTNYSSPIQIGALTNWKSLSAGYNHVTSIKTDGTLWAWGYGYYGQLGNNSSGSSNNYSSPIQIGALTNWKQVSAGDWNTAAIKTDGTLWTWGSNEYGQLGYEVALYNTSSAYTMRKFEKGTGWVSNDSNTQVTVYTSAGATGAFAAIKTDGTLWTWGLGLDGVLGNGTGTYIVYSSPIQVGANTNWKQVTVGGNTQLADFMLSVKTDGTLWAWGNNVFGQLGTGTITRYSSPVQIGSLNNWKQVSGGHLHTAAIKTDGTLWTWGRNLDPSSTGYGALGNGTTINYSSPIQIGALTNWKQVTAGYGLTYAVKTDGTLWAWGYQGGPTGSLGNGTTVDYSSPIQIGALTTWASITTVGGRSGAAIKTDGTLWVWGSNGNGQLGIGTAAGYSSPVQVGLLTDWKQVAIGNEHLMAVKNNGTLWGCGSAMFGQLGMGYTGAPTLRYSSPIQIGSLTNWNQVFCGYHQTFGFTTDNNLYSCGYGGLGQLGSANTLISNSSSPQQVGANTNWKQVSCASASTTYNMMAIKTDGTLWGWGRNSNGQLGNGTRIDYSSPIQIGALTNWRNIRAGQTHTLATKTDGTLWTWGQNNRGQLGLGNTLDYSSPVQVGTATNWRAVSVTKDRRSFFTTYMD